MKREKGNGSIRKIENRFYYRTQEGGKEKAIRLKASTLDEAVAEAKQYQKIAMSEDQEEFAFHLRRLREKSGNLNRLKLEDGFRVFQDSPRRARCGEKQLQQHRTYWTEFIEKSGLDYFDQIDEPAAEKFFASYRGGDVAYNRRIKTLRMVWRIVMHGKPSPFAEIPFRKENPTPKKEFNAEQLAAVFRAADHDYPLSVPPNRDEVRLLLRVLAYTGMSLKDGCLLDWEDISCDTIKTRRHKTGSKVTVPIHPALREMLPPRASGPVMPHVSLRYQSNPSGMDRTVNRIIAWAMEPKHETYMANHAKKFKIPETSTVYGAHSFRHSFVSFCANAGVPIDIVRDIVGHSSAAVTRIYTHFTDQTRAAVIAALPDVGRK